MKKYLAICLLTGLIVPVSSSGSGFSSLRFGGDARSAAAGMAAVAAGNTGAAGFWNPAGLADLESWDMIVSVQRWMQDVRSEFLGVGHGNGSTGLGLHILYTTVGDMEHRTAATPEPLGLFSSHELVMGLSYARRLGKRLRLGITAKAYYEKLFLDEALGGGADIGLLYLIRENGLRLGASVQNLGKTSTLYEDDIDLPVTLRAGAALPFSGPGGQWLLLADGVQVRNLPFHLHTGIEWNWQERLYVRLGYQSGYDNRDLSGGLGIVWHRLRLDYSYTPIASGLGDSHRVAFGTSW